MAAYVIAVFQVANLTSTDVQKKYIPETGIGSKGALRAANGLAKLAAGLAGGTIAGKLSALTVVDAAGTASAGAIACTRANAAGNNVVFTYGAVAITLTEGSGASFLRGASDTTCGDNLAAAINAHAVLSTIMTAVAVTGTITLTAKIPTALPHDIAITTDDGTAFALTQFTGGTEGAAKFFLQGFQTGKTL